ncbi:MAG: FISUMP domain-containing protein [Chitinivibrionales bacterium]
MVLIKALLSGLFGVSLCMANISGIVTDTGSRPISGAVVQLEKGGQTATTGADGSFTLVTSTGILPVNGKMLPNGPSVGITGNLMTVAIGERAAVEIATFDLNGKALSNVRQTMETGLHTIALPQRKAGVYLYKVKSGYGEVVLKGNTIGGASSGSGVTAQDPASNRLAKKAVVPINDVIAATKTGYLNYRCVQYSSDTTGLKIKMIASAGTVTDLDGNVYQTVRIGNQIWTVENLRVTRLNDGTAILLDTSTGTGDIIWNNGLTIPAYCYYNNMTNTDSIKKWGALYNWYVVNAGKLAPKGWHVPSDSEWEVMQNYLVINGYNYDGTTDTTNNKIAMALAAQTDWQAYIGVGFPGNNLTKNNGSGFSALPGGYRYYYGYFGRSSSGDWWSATVFDASNAWYRYLLFGNDYLYRYYYCSDCCGFSVRLVRDN